VPLELSVSAPGKLFLAGEYAVTRGGSAVVASVSRRLACHASSRPGTGRIEVRHGASRWTLGPAVASAEAAPPQLRFVAFAAWLAARTLGLGDLDVAIETDSALDDSPEKTGLGGSAAATVATISTMWAMAGRDPVGEATRGERVAAALLAHRAAQGGGSGADVVASTCGGLSFVAGLDRLPRPRSLEEAAASLPSAAAVSVEGLRTPHGLALEAVGTGRAARTGPRASRFELGFGGPDRGSLEAWSEGMESATREFVDALRAGAADRTRRAFEASGRWLERLAPIVSMPILSPRLRLACSVARRAGAAARVSGAGGGDCAVALVGEDRRVTLREKWREAGLRPLAVDVDQGPRVESSGRRSATHG
jgi:phosphomevalonate kinase